MTIPGEVYTALILFLVAVIVVGTALVRAWGKNAAAKQELAAAQNELTSEKTKLRTAETERKAVEVANATKYEEMGVRLAEQHKELNLTLQKTIIEATTTFSHQVGELSGKLAIESQARRDVESKFEVVSSQKVRAGEEVIRLQTVLKQTEKERDEYKVKLDDFMASVGDIDAMRKQITDLTVVVEKQAREIDDMKDREKRQHDQADAYSTRELQRAIELKRVVQERDVLKDALDEVRLVNEKQAIEITELKKINNVNESEALKDGTVGGFAEAVS